MFLSFSSLLFLLLHHPLLPMLELSFTKASPSNLQHLHLSEPLRHTLTNLILSERSLLVLLVILMLANHLLLTLSSLVMVARELLALLVPSWNYYHNQTNQGRHQIESLRLPGVVFPSTESSTSASKKKSSPVDEQSRLVLLNALPPKQIDDPVPAVSLY